MKILVTGASGLIGSNLVETLYKGGCAIYKFPCPINSGIFL